MGAHESRVLNDANVVASRIVLKAAEDVEAAARASSCVT